jgi:polyhydroxybutyrate depolymerase
MMSMDLACRYPGEYAAIAVVAGVSDVKACAQHLGPPVPLLTFHGTADDAVEFDGGFSPNVNSVTGLPDGRPRDEIVASWAQANRCGPEPTVSAVEPNLERIVHDCPPDAAVELYVIAGGPHEWPGGGADDDPEASESESTSAIEATELILEFFEQHPSGG